MCNHDNHPTRLIISGDKSTGELHLELVGERSELCALIVAAIMKDKDYADILESALGSYKKHKPIYELFDQLGSALGGQSVSHIPSDAPSGLIDALNKSLGGIIEEIKSRAKPKNREEAESAINELFGKMKDEIQGKKEESPPTKERKPTKKAKIPNNS